MHRFLSVVLLVLVGCQGLVGPLRRPDDRIDDPRLSIEEQEKRGRERLALPQGKDVGPPTYADDPFGRGR
jgi:hypothetical protein